MTKLQEILAQNLKEKRQKSGLTQGQLAEKVNVSTHHIGMIEISRTFPTLDLVERIAEALEIEIYELFLDRLSPHEELKRLRQEIREDTKQLLDVYLDKIIADSQKR